MEPQGGQAPVPLGLCSIADKPQGGQYALMATNGATPHGQLIRASLNSGGRPGISGASRTSFRGNLNFGVSASFFQRMPYFLNVCDVG